MMKTFLYLILYICATFGASAQYRVTENRQHAFPHSVPPGNYSGLTWLGGDTYAVVSDKAKEDGFFVFEIKVDSISGEILAARNLGFRSGGFPNRDNEDIAYNPHSHTLWMTGEADNRILEYNMDGMRTLREAELPEVYRHLPPNLGLEALTFNPHTQTLWTCNESDSILIQSFDHGFRPLHQYVYSLDLPKANREKALFYAHGVGAICALDDGSLLVLEREFYVPQAKLGSFVQCKLFRFSPESSAKQLLADWKTGLSLLGRSLANYEGMCLGPTLADGSRVILLIADSQNQYGGVMKDWLKSLKLEMPKQQAEQP